MGLDGQMRHQSAAGKLLSVHKFSAAMIAPDCDGGAGGPGCFVARDFVLTEVTGGSILHLSAQGL